MKLQIISLPNLIGNRFAVKRISSTNLARYIGGEISPRREVGHITTCLTHEMGRKEWTLDTDLLNTRNPLILVWLLLVWGPTRSNQRPGGTRGLFLKWRRSFKTSKWGILTPYPKAEWVFSPESIMPPRPIERSSRAEGAWCSREEKTHSAEGEVWE